MEKIKLFGLRIKIFKEIELDTFLIYADWYIKTKIRTGGDRVYTYFCGLNVQEVGVEFEDFIIVSIDFLLAYDIKYYLYVYSDNYASKTIDKL